MAIETNKNEQPSQQAPQPQQGQSAAFSGATLNETGAPTGSMDFLSLSSRVGINRIDSTIEPYLNKVMELVKDNLSNVQLVRLVHTSNAYAIQHDGPDGTLNFFGLLFVSASDPISQQLIPQSAKINRMRDELKEMFKDRASRLVDCRLVLGGYGPDMSREYEMADTIVREFQVTSDPAIKNANISVIATNEFTVDWRISEARQAERMLSAHGIAPRMDVGLTLKAKIQNPMGREIRDIDADYRVLGVIGGYTEIREKEVFVNNNVRELRYQPVFNITVCNAIIPLEGIGAILYAALAPTIYNTLFWARQWIDLSEGNPNPGMLEEDPDHRGRPIVLKDQEELKDFIHSRFAPPVIAVQFQDGRDGIPGMTRMMSSDPKQKLIFANRLANFFGVEGVTDVSGIVMGVNIDERFDGAYGDPNGALHDSRNIDYLAVAAKNGVSSIDTNMRRVLLGGSDRPEERARIVANVTNSFVPLWFNTVAAINPDFIKWIIDQTDNRRLVITDPNHQVEARSLGSFISGFGSAANLGSIVSSGHVSRGLNLSSFWN